MARTSSQQRQHLKKPPMTSNSSLHYSRRLFFQNADSSSSENADSSSSENADSSSSKNADSSSSENADSSSSDDEVEESISGIENFPSYILNQPAQNNSDYTDIASASETNNYANLPNYIADASTNSETCNSESNSSSNSNESSSISNETDYDPEMQSDHESIDNEIHNVEDVNEFETPVYDGSRISMRGSFLLIAQFSRRYKLHRTAVNDLLHLISLHCPEENKLPRSSHGLFSKLIPRLEDSPKIKLCSTCFVPLDNTQDDICSSGHAVQKDERKATYFRRIPLEAQLRSVLQDNASAIESYNAERTENFEQCPKLADISDGKYYKKRLDDLDKPEQAVSLTMNTDGAPVFKSTKFSIWPVYVCIVELPPGVRYYVKNILLAGLWYGPLKPNMNVFLKPIVEEIQHLQTTGMQWMSLGTMYTSYVQLLCVVCDLPAKAIVTNMKQFNGKFGCCNCLHPGKKLDVRGNVRVFPFKKNGHKLRTSEETRVHAHVAEVSRKPVFGVKGTSILHNIIDVPSAVPVDYMHCILQGVAKRLLKAFFEPSREDYCVRVATAEVDKKLNSISVPHDMERKPRSLTYIKYWKATEMQHWLLYFSLPVLKGLLPDQIFHHLGLLVTAVWISLKRNIAEEEVKLVGTMFESFCRLMKTFYGERSDTINVHNLLHLEDQLMNFGPLWSHSAFPFEAMIAHLLKGFSGTRGAGDQMISNYLIEKSLEPLKRELLESTENQEIKEFSLKMSKSTICSNWTSTPESTIYCSRMKEYIFDEKVASLLNEFFNSEIQDEDNSILSYCEGDKCQSADRIMIQPSNEIYHSRDYKRAGKSCSSIVQCFSSIDDSLMYGDIQIFLIVNGLALSLLKPFNQYASTICQIEMNVPDDDVVCQLATNGLLGAHHIPVDTPDDNELLVIPCSMIRAKCVLVETPESTIFGYLTPIIDYICK